VDETYVKVAGRRVYLYRAIDQFGQVIDLMQLRCARVITTGHAFIQNIRRGHYEVGTKDQVNRRVLTAFNELA
ncbi:MAG TPA: DDE-type integrase/transposase/recombinase, partial [Pseudonocardiaceae bacterium]|nr:DDE-type integrase/transposase/recombinase [Pseudonocardiaceae bacterium]